MYAVVKTGGKQYRVTAGDYIVVERLTGQNGEKIELNDILLIDQDGQLTIGEPFVKDASVKATIIDQNRARKIIVFKKKRRKNYRRKQGHRQDQTILHVSEIHASGKVAKAEKAPKVVEVKETAQPVEKKASVKKAAPKEESAVKKPAAKASSKAAAVKKPAAAKKPAAKKATTSKKIEK